MGRGLEGILNGSAHMMKVAQVSTKGVMRNGRVGESTASCASGPLYIQKLRPTSDLEIHRRRFVSLSQIQFELKDVDKLKRIATRAILVVGCLTQGQKDWPFS